MAREPGRPYLTYYDDATGERTELSYATFENWVAKTANLLVDGLGVAPGDVVTVRLPAHWQTVVVTMAAWRAGAAVGAGSAVALVAEDWLDATTAPEVVGLSLRPFGAGLARPRPGVTDYAEEVPAYGDAFPGRLEHAVLDGIDLLPTAAALAGALAETDRLYATTTLGWLAAYLAGAGVLLEREPRPEGWPARFATERVTAAAGPASLVPALPAGTIVLGLDRGN